MIFKNSNIEVSIDTNGTIVINFKAGADYTYHNKVNAWTKGNIVITHNESFDSYSLEIFE